ncbi:cache domain-containing protein [uncultured Rhodospira sp.]|uniref:cache domain-containing protein n=1 Tax=uncultured Rhodospira sp. TaxID=1936189 RepID=UPI00262008E5|nr:cache domain-containing protein [uncultured Rhodospira sp.]
MSIKAFIRGALVVLLCQTVAVGGALAADRATKEEAKAMAEDAAAYYEEHGEAAFDVFTNGDMFKDRDLYVFMMDLKGTMVAHGQNPSLIGRDTIGLRDPSGKAFIQEFVAVEDKAWVSYQWQNPTTGGVDDKVSYIINVGDYVLGVGAYE